MRTLANCIISDDVRQPIEAMVRDGIKAAYDKETPSEHQSALAELIGNLQWELLLARQTIENLSK